MKLTKRILCLTTAAVLLLALCACGNKVNPADANATPGTTTTTNAMGGNLDGENVYNDGVFGEW